MMSHLMIQLTDTAWRPVAIVFFSLFLLQTAQAGGTRQLATGGVSTIEGSAGGGLVPWAVLTGYATEEEVSASAFYSRADTGDYILNATGVAVNFYNRLELSYARQELDLVTLGPALGLPGATLEQDIVGLKLRLFGDIIYTAAPQVSLGVQYKKNRSFSETPSIPRIVGAEDEDGVDVYLSAAKLFLAGAGGYNLFVNGTVRYSKANETGLLGFGGPGDSDYDVTVGGAVGVLFTRRLAIGTEYRQKSGNLGLPESDWRDVFIAWFPNRHVSFTAAYVDLGEVATLPEQTGWYVSIQGSF
ncbi:MAG TPA: DUF3034 family protein [Gammaproteobacteria bacterium]|nr:DUF3034 family protein [Gammaproteobacteria bacterium]